VFATTNHCEVLIPPTVRVALPDATPAGIVAVISVSDQFTIGMFVLLMTSVLLP
jgi:hypothetical protein